jgi:hypothetical protein
MSTEVPPELPEQPSDIPHSPSLDSSCDNPTRWETRLSGPEPDTDGSTRDADPDFEWGRQHKRTYHRVNTLLHYWESRDYLIRWITLTSGPDCDDADCLAYNLQRLRQTVERAKLAYKADGVGRRLSHINEIEQLCVRTSEGPPGKGVLHLFWAWKPPAGHHSRDFFIPQEWLAYQWGRIHGPHDEHSEEAVQPLYVWIEEYGSEDYHSRQNVARYCCTQYLGDHGEALEHVSWSHGRTLGGNLTEAWEAVRDHREALSEAIEVWERCIAGERVTLGSQSEHVHYGLAVKPPPNLGVELVEEVSITPPDEYREQGPDVATVRRVETMPEYDPAEHERGLCPECSEFFVVEEIGAGRDDHSGSASSSWRVSPDEVAAGSDDRVSYVCTSRRCQAKFAAPGEGKRVTEQEFATLDTSPSPATSGDRTTGTTLEDTETRVTGSHLEQLSRSGGTFEPDESVGETDGEDDEDDTKTKSVEQRIRETVATSSEVTPVEVIGQLGLPPTAVGTAEAIISENQ